MYSHYTNASQRTMQMKGELITLKGHMHGDSVKIKGDMGRIMVIHKQLNDIFYIRKQTRSTDTIEQGLVKK